MRDGWFYNEQGKAAGPFSLDLLVSHLRKKTDPRNIEVWKTGYQNWRLAKDVPQIDELLLKSERKTKRRLVAFIVVLLIVLGTGAIFSTLIYDNSPGGIGGLIGELFGAGVIISILAIPARRTTYMPAVALGVAALSVAIQNTPKLIESIDARQGIKALSDLHDPEQALKNNPSNTFLQLMTETNKLAQETGRAASVLFAEIEPPALADSINFATATRADLQTYLNNLKIAETNAMAAMPRFVALQKKERNEMDRLAQSLKISDSVRRDFLVGVDKRQATNLAFNSKMMAAHGEFYRAFGNYIDVLIEQYGNYRVEPNGQFRFTDRSASDRFAVAADAVNVGAKKVEELGDERKQLEQLQQREWQRLIAGQ